MKGLGKMQNSLQNNSEKDNIDAKRVMELLRKAKEYRFADITLKIQDGVLAFAEITQKLKF